MKPLLIMLALACAATAAETNAPPQLVIALTDGSRLVGTTELAALAVRSVALGRIEIPLAKVRSVKFGKDHESATVALVNGDDGGFRGIVRDVRFDNRALSAAEIASLATVSR
jgi:hypothetical protein